jgi:probable HAF family extracellular repeat protein
VGLRAQSTPSLDSADCTIVTPLQLSLRQLCLSESTLNCPIRTAPAGFRRRPSPWIGVTSGQSNESRINSLTHHADEGSYQFRNVLTNHTGTCAAFNTNFLYNLVPVHALLWEKGKAIDLGNLGGQTGQAGGNIAYDINNQGQVVGNSDLQGDTTFDAFLWTNRTGMQDLHTLSGDVSSTSISINDAGSVVGLSLDADFNPRAFLWEKGVMTDLNTLIAGDSPLYLISGCSINSSGEITGLGLTSSGEIHTYLARPAHGVATSESTSQRGINPRVLSDDARKLLQQQLRFGRFGARLMGLQ